jgi:hypothetical protein
MAADAGLDPDEVRTFLAGDSGTQEERERASALDGRLRHHREERTSWHRKWDDLPR